LNIPFWKKFKKKVNPKGVKALKNIKTLINPEIETNPETRIIEEKTVDIEATVIAIRLEEEIKYPHSNTLPSYYLKLPIAVSI
jgi:hypothetical protein